jgi:hypothetical protein
MTPPPLREEIAVPGSPEATLLNDHQRRHLGITLGQVQRLLHQIGALLTAPAPRDGLETEADDLPAEFGRRAPEAIAGLDRKIAQLADRFALERREHSRYRWVRAVLGISIDDLEDVRAESLRPYGDVDPALAPALDPGLRAVQDELRGLLALLEPPGEPG